jgi:hypothetical protein
METSVETGTTDPSTPARSQRRVVLRPREDAAAASVPAKGPSSGPGLPFWMVTVLLLALPVTLGGILLALWVALFGSGN